MEQTLKLELTKQQLDTLFLALRYVEINHPGRNETASLMRPVFRAQFHKLLNEINNQLKQGTLF